MKIIVYILEKNKIFFYNISVIEKGRLIRKIILSMLIMLVSIFGVPFLLISVFHFLESGILALVILFAVVFGGTLPFCIYLAKWIGRKYY